MLENHSVLKQTVVATSDKRITVAMRISAASFFGFESARSNELPRKEILSAMSQLHSNLLKLLLTKKHLKISAMKARKLREALKKLHEETAGQGKESLSYFGVPLHLQQQVTSSLTSSPVPIILENLTAYMLSCASQEGIFRISANERRALTLKDLVEEGNANIPTDFEFSVHDIACVFKRWLRNLPEPVIPVILHEVFIKCVELESHHHRTQSLLLACLLMPTFHLNTLKHIALFLREIAEQEGDNRMPSANLARILAPSLMPCTTKTEANADVAMKFNKMSRTAVQVLIDHAQLIASLPPELEPLSKDCYKILSEDEFSDHGEPLMKRKLFTFLKPKHITQKGINRSTGVTRNSRKVNQGMSPISKSVKRLTPTEVDNSNVETDNESSAKVDIRITRSVSKKRQLSAETVGRIRERRALKAIQNTRSQPSVRSSLPTIGGGRRRSVRRAATCRAGRIDSQPETQKRNQMINNVLKSKSVEADNQKKSHSPVRMREPKETQTTEPPSSPSATDKETARKSFLATMLGLNQDNENKEKISENENHYQQTIVTSADASNGHDHVDGSVEPVLDRHGAHRKPLMPSNRRALRRDIPPGSKVTTTITVQL